MLNQKAYKLEVCDFFFKKWAFRKQRGTKERLYCVALWEMEDPVRCLGLDLK